MHRNMVVLNNPWFMAKKMACGGHDKTDIYAYLKASYKITDDLNLSIRFPGDHPGIRKRTEQVPSSANLNTYTNLV